MSPFDMAQDRLVIGLTGGIGCGKSAVANLFAKYGVVIIDTDTIAHDLTQADGIAIAAIRAAFGDCYIRADGALDRKKMRGLIFSDSASKQRLEQILHPLILEQVKIRIQQLQSSPYIVAVVPLLTESPDFQKLVRRVLVVDCAEDLQIKRVIQRNGMTAQEIRAIISQQTPRTERLRLADDVIHNGDSLDNLAEQVAILHERYSGTKNDI